MSHLTPKVCRLHNYFKMVRLVFIAAFCASLLAGCGFKLRNDFELDSKFRQLRVLDAGQPSQLADVLIQRLDIYYQVDVLNKTQPKLHQEFKVPTIIVAPERLERKLLSLFPSGQVAEYELLYFCDYQVQSAEGEIKDYTFRLSREYQDDPDQVLAKSRELELILDEMRSQAADRIIRQLSVEQHKG